LEADSPLLENMAFGVVPIVAKINGVTDSI